MNEVSIVAGLLSMISYWIGWLVRWHFSKKEIENLHFEVEQLKSERIEIIKNAAKAKKLPPNCYANIVDDEVYISVLGDDRTNGCDMIIATVPLRY